MNKTIEAPHSQECVSTKNKDLDYSENFSFLQENSQKKAQNFNDIKIEVMTEGLIQMMDDPQNSLTNNINDYLKDQEKNTIHDFLKVLKNKKEEIAQDHNDLMEIEKGIKFLIMEKFMRDKQTQKVFDIFKTPLNELGQKIEFIKPFNDKDLLIKGAVHMFSANPGGCKTTFISDICAELITQGKFKFCIHIDPENIISAYEERNQRKIKELLYKNQWKFIEPINLNTYKASNLSELLDISINSEKGYFKDTIIFIDSYGVMIDRNDNTEVSKFLTQCQYLSNKTGATIIITTHNNKNGLVYTGGASNIQYTSLFYQLHTISRENGKKAILLECTKSRYGTQEQFTQGYELDFSAQSCTPERYTIIDEYEVSELIEQIYNKANGTARHIKESKKAELSQIDLIEKIHEVLLSGEKTATQIAIALGKPKNYVGRKLIPLLNDSGLLGVRWIKTQNKDAQGRIYDFYRLAIK